MFVWVTLVINVRNFMKKIILGLLMINSVSAFAECTISLPQNHLGRNIGTCLEPLLSKKNWHLTYGTDVKNTLLELKQTGHPTIFELTMRPSCGYYSCAMNFLEVRRMTIEATIHTDNQTINLRAHSILEETQHPKGGTDYWNLYEKIARKIVNSLPVCE
jgi:hypothetical protein